MSYKQKLPYVLEIYNTLIKGEDLFPLYELLRTYCKREFYNTMVSYLRTINSDIILNELLKIEDDNMRNELTDLLT